jgi:hypothetical protein
MVFRKRLWQTPFLKKSFLQKTFEKICKNSFAAGIL